MCDFGAYNKDSCGYDGGDCIELNAQHGNCTLEFPNWAGDTICWDNLYANCILDYPSLVGNGECNGGKYMSPECGYDGEDCIEFLQKYPICIVDYPYYVGDGKMLVMENVTVASICHQNVVMMDEIV